MCGRIAQQVRRSGTRSARTPGWQVAPPLPEGSLRWPARRGPSRPAANHRRRSGCGRDRADVAHHAGRRDALVDPFDGGGGRLFPDHDPPDVGSVRLAAAPQPAVQAVGRSVVRRQGARYRRPLPLAAQPGACSQHRREKPDPGPGPRTASLADDAWHPRASDAQLRAARDDLAVRCLDVASGFVIAKCYKRHRAAEFLNFLKEIDAQVPDGLDVHIVMDNYATHKTPKIKAWLARRPHYHVHFTPTSASWINQVERWFAELTRKRLRRGVHTSVRQLQADIRAFIDRHNQNPRPFKWTRSADQILASVKRFCHKTQQTLCGEL